MIEQAIQHIVASFKAEAEKMTTNFDSFASMEQMCSDHAGKIEMLMQQHITQHLQEPSQANTIRCPDGVGAIYKGDVKKK
jgi:hypothetical protein